MMVLGAVAIAVLVTLVILFDHHRHALRRFALRWIPFSDR